MTTTILVHVTPSLDGADDPAPLEEHESTNRRPGSIEEEQ